MRDDRNQNAIRSFHPICLYNDTVATGDGDRLAITNQDLRELSGVNGLSVGDWVKAHADEVISHNSKYGMQNARDHILSSADMARVLFKESTRN